MTSLLDSVFHSPPSGTTPTAHTETISQFLPGTKVAYAWDATSLGLLKTCPRLYQYIIIEGWQPRGESVHLRFGQELHQAFQDYHKERAAGIKHNDAVFDTTRELLTRTVGWEVDEDTKAGKYKNRRTLVRTVIEYLDKYQTDPATTYVKDDGQAAVELSFRFDLDWGPESARIPCPTCNGTGFIGPHNYDGVCPDCGGQKLAGPPQPYLLCGHLDRVVRFNDELFVMDYKTTTTTPGDYYFDQYHPNNQMTLYSLASGVILEAPIQGVIIDAIQILVDTSRSVRGITYRTSAHLDEWLKDLEFWLSLAEGYAEANYWPMNDTACDKFGGCRFREICQKDPRVREQFLKGNYEQLEESKRWNPLAVR